MQNKNHPNIHHTWLRLVMLYCDLASLDFARMLQGLFSEIGVGRYRHITLKDRICQLCINAVEDEIHFLCECTRYMDDRQSLCQEAKEVDLLLMHMDIIKQYMLLVTNLQKVWLNFLIKRYQEQHIDGLVQERRNSIDNALELRLSSTNPLISYNKNAVQYTLCPKGPLTVQVHFTTVQWSTQVRSYHCAVHMRRWYSETCL